jgi:hypothetical protein
LALEESTFTSTIVMATFNFVLMAIDTDYNFANNVINVDYA